jgi:hypothetical protein
VQYPCLSNVAWQKEQKLPMVGKKWDFLKQKSIDIQYQSGAFYFFNQWDILHLGLLLNSAIRPLDANYSLPL